MGAALVDELLTQTLDATERTPVGRCSDTHTTMMELPMTWIQAEPRSLAPRNAVKRLGVRHLRWPAHADRLLILSLVGASTKRPSYCPP